MKESTTLCGAKFQYLNYICVYKKFMEMKELKWEKKEKKRKKNSQKKEFKKNS